jgi:mRNA-degrading endonuclease RelE of RelBE toxin-antitoxin system
MKVIQDPSVDAAIRTLSDEDRRKVSVWLTRLKNWENDEHTRKISKTTVDKSVHVLNTTDDIRIFFKLDQEAKEITILDIAKPSRFKNINVKTAAE